MTSPSHVLKDRERDITFDGAMIATASSEDNGKDRWSEMSLYLIDDGRYVVHGVGRSRVPGEVDRYWACVCNTPAAVIQALTRTSAKDQSYMPTLNIQLLRRGSQIDNALQEASSAQAI